MTVLGLKLHFVLNHNSTEHKFITKWRQGTIIDAVRRVADFNKILNENGSRNRVRSRSVPWLAQDLLWHGGQGVLPADPKFARPERPNMLDSFADNWSAG